MSQPALILASGSASRRALLDNAGIEAQAVRPNLDEETARAGMRAEGISVRDQAVHLAELKALKVSSARPGLVVGGDQMLNLDGRALDKPADLAEARTHLETLSGRTHTLETALVICEGGTPVWRHVAQPRLTMRPLSGDFIDSYLERAGKAVLTTVGAYQLESLGSQLFARIEGDYFSILGMPLLALMDYLRTRGVLAT
ncbi:MAG: septum formation protein Maf [Alphaproteobacteria bacterium]|jgi:septum formation protein|nr:septum formation protein Maf [Alphaproteobacteria bacterium]